LVRTGIRNGRAVAAAPRQKFVPDARDIHRNWVSRAREIPRLYEIAELESEHRASTILHIEVCLIKASLEGQRKHVVHWLHQPDHAAWTVRARSVAFQVAQIGFEVSVPPYAQRSAGANLIDNPRVRFEERRRTKVGSVQHREVLKAFGAEYSDLAALEQVIQC